MYCNSKEIKDIITKQRDILIDETMITCWEYLLDPESADQARLDMARISGIADLYTSIIKYIDSEDAKKEC